MAMTPDPLTIPDAQLSPERLALRKWARDRNWSALELRDGATVGGTEAGWLRFTSLGRDEDIALAIGAAGL